MIIVALQWDTYRTLYPLYSLHDPVRFAQIVRGLIIFSNMKVRILMRYFDCIYPDCSCLGQAGFPNAVVQPRNISYRVEAVHL